MNYWLLKSEPEEYSWEDFLNDKKAVWDGVRNYQARNNLCKMRLDDRVLFYHSGKDPEIAGVAAVCKEHYPDPVDHLWFSVNLVPVKSLAEPVSLKSIKSHPLLKKMILARQSRLSVMPVTAQEFRLILKLGKTKQ